MKFKIFTFSFMLIFAACSFGTTVLTTNEPHKQTSALLEVLKKRNEDDEDE